MPRPSQFKGLNAAWSLTLSAGFVVCVVILVGAMFLASGCAAGRGPAGEVIVGWDVAQLPETVGELGQAAAGFLPPPWNYLAGAGALALTAYAGKKRGETTGWDQAVGTPAQAGRAPSEKQA